MSGSQACRVIRSQERVTTSSIGFRTWLSRIAIAGVLVYMKLTMFYDSWCPLCAAEVRQLQALDQQNHLRFVDIHGHDFRTDWPHIDPERANRVLHAQRADGSLLYGLDVSAEVWSIVGRHRWLKLLRLPVIRWFADLGYLVFARYRYGISYLLTGQRRCATCDPDNRAGCADRGEQPPGRI